MPGPKERHGKLVLFISGRVVEASQKQVMLLACLYDNLGHVIPYERLCLPSIHRIAMNYLWSARSRRTGGFAAQRLGCRPAEDQFNIYALRTELRSTQATGSRLYRQDMR